MKKNLKYIEKYDPIGYDIQWQENKRKRDIKKILTEFKGKTSAYSLCFLNNSGLKKIYRNRTQK